jgi:hypothetical protein
MVTQLIQRKMRLGKYIIDFLIILAIMVAGACFIFLYMDFVKRIKAMQKDLRVIEYNQINKKTF